ncbi:MAG: DUF1254 domain-containing protein [Xanthobacteraceae bacterium]|nr:DUF1254 domain-containing protein [Xanthobacteraceae bacterium]
MIRIALWLLGGVLLGGIVHFTTVLWLPELATQDAYSRLTPVAPVNAVAPVSAPTPDKSVVPFLDPAFAMAVCRYDLGNGPLKFSVPVSPAYTSVSFYTRNDVAYYAINDRAAGRRVIELDLMTSDQRSELPGDEEVTAADRLIVESPTLTGLIVIKALAPEPGLMAAAQAALKSAKCAAAG